MNKLPGSFDARDWAKEFVEHVQKNPAIPCDEETMICWFANAIMAGYDRRESEYLRKSLFSRARDWYRTIWMRRLLKEAR